MALDKQNVWQLPTGAKDKLEFKFFVCPVGTQNLMLGHSQTCELQIICAVHVKHMWFILACETLWKKNLLLDTKPALIFSCENFCEFMGSYYLFACIAVMQCFLQTLERFCSTMLKIWHEDAWTLNFKFILSA